jgi:hypothetical protein
MTASRTRYQVFVSSTSWELDSERKAAVNAILGARHIPAGTEYFAPENRLPTDVIKRWIEDADIFCLLLGPRYGPIDPGSGKSHVECEYDHAMSIGKPVFALVLDDAWCDHKLSRSDILRAEVERQDGSAYQAFRSKARQLQIPPVHSLDDLEARASWSLQALYGSNNLRGWVRSDQVGRLSPEHSYLNGPWVDAAYLPPCGLAPAGAVCFGTRCEVEVQDGFFTTQGYNYDYEGHQIGKYVSSSSAASVLEMDYTFRWNTRAGRDSILGCGKLKINDIPVWERRSGARDATYSGYFFTESSPTFLYEGRKLREGEKKGAGTPVVARWMEHLSSTLGYPIATPEQVSRLLRSNVGMR